MMVKGTYRITEEQHQDLTRLSEKTGQFVISHIRFAIAEYIRKAKERKEI